MKGAVSGILGPLVLASLLLGVLYGLFMGLYATFNRTPPCHEQLLTCAIKVPAQLIIKGLGLE